MKKIHHFLKWFFRLIFSCYITEGNSGFLLYIHLCITLSNAHHSAALGHPTHQETQTDPNKCEWKYNTDQNIKKHCWSRIWNLCPILNARFIETLWKILIFYFSSKIFYFQPWNFLLFRSNYKLIGADPNFFYFTVIYHLQKFTVRNLLWCAFFHKLIKAKHNDRRNQCCDYNNPKALFVVLLVIFVLVVHSFPPNYHLFYYKYGLLINQ